MSFRNIVKDVRDGIGSLSRRSFEVRLPGLRGHHRGKTRDLLHEQNNDHSPGNDQSRWANLPPELLRDVIKRLEASESTWPSRKHVLACAAVCRSWRDMCKEIVKSPEISGKLTFPISLKQAGPRDGTIQCFIKRDKSKSTYHLYLSLSSSVLVESGKFLLSAKRYRKATCTEYIISTDANSISRSSSAYIGKLRSNFIGTKFVIYDTQPPYTGASVCPPGLTSRRFHSKKISPKVPTGNYNIAQVAYELNVLGTRGPRRMHCIIYSIPVSALEPGGIVPGQPETFAPHPLGDSFRSMSFSKKSIIDHSTEFSSSHYINVAGESSHFSDVVGGSSRFFGVTGESSRFSDISGGNYFSDVTGGIRLEDEEENNPKDRPLVLRNKPPRWHEQLQCWCLNFRGRVTVASVKNFQLIAAMQPSAGAPTPSQPAPPEHDKVLLQFGKVAKDMFTMDYRYPLSAFQAFAICLSSYDTKLACE